MPVRCADDTAATHFSDLDPEHSFVRIEGLERLGRLTHRETKDRGHGALHEYERRRNDNERWRVVKGSLNHPLQQTAK